MPDPHLPDPDHCPDCGSPAGRSSCPGCAVAAAPDQEDDSAPAKVLRGVEANTVIIFLCAFAGALVTGALIGGGANVLQYLSVGPDQALMAAWVVMLLGAWIGLVIGLFLAGPDF